MTFSGPEIDRGILLVLGLTVLVLFYLVLRHTPRTAVALALATICFVPIWVGAGIGFNANLFLPAASVVAVLAIAALLPVAGFRFSSVDAVVLFLTAVAASSMFTGKTSVALSFLTTVFVTFLPGYVLGRIAVARVGLSWLYGAVAVVFTGVAILAIIEFLFGWNPFVLVSQGSASLFEQWGPLQERGGIVRAEGAFGHSIALGSSLAMAIPLTFGSSFRLPIRAGMTLLMLIASAFTFSRIGIVGALLGLVLSLAFLRGAATVATRLVLLAVTAIVTAALVPVVLGVFTEAGTEASGSASYRGDLLSLIGDMNLIGISDLARHAPTGELYFQNFQSIDSQLILTGITSGAIALVAILIALAGALVLMVTGRASAATIAVVAQIPALATVALITQYSTLLWFVVGVAASSQLATRPASTALVEPPVLIKPAIPRRPVTSTRGT